jgi:hypothetical protein
MQVAVAGRQGRELKGREGQGRATQGRAGQRKGCEVSDGLREVGMDISS